MLIARCAIIMIIFKIFIFRHLLLHPPVYVPRRAPVRPDHSPPWRWGPSARGCAPPAGPAALWLQPPRQTVPLLAAGARVPPAGHEGAATVQTCL